jgi:putative glutamine amidotransferase
VRRPIIGLTTYLEPASWALYRDVPAAMLHLSYIHAIQAAGGRPVLLPPDEVDAEVVDILDGLVLTGGADIDPARYRQEPHPATHPKPYRDEAETLLAKTALDRDLPILGVCRGMQLLAVVTGGSLHQHLPDLVHSYLHRPPPFDQPTYGDHAVHIDPDSRLHEIIGEEAKVHSLHHQAVDDPGSFTPVGWCAEDGIIEAMESPRHQYAVAVQWHPETDPDTPLFQSLVTASQIP